jgi:hypothetical protein
MIIKSNVFCSIVFFCLIFLLFLHTCLFGFVRCYSFNIIITCFIYLHHTHTHTHILIAGPYVLICWCITRNCKLRASHESRCYWPSFGGRMPVQVASQPGTPRQCLQEHAIKDAVIVRCQQAKSGFSPGEPRRLAKQAPQQCLQGEKWLSKASSLSKAFARCPATPHCTC